MGVTVSPLCVVAFGALTGLREVVLGAVAANAGGIAALLKGVPGLADAGVGLRAGGAHGNRALAVVGGVGCG